MLLSRSAGQLGDDDVFVAEPQDGFEVGALERCISLADDLDVLLRHRLRSISPERGPR
jgi:hypothetical protein